MKLFIKFINFVLYSNLWIAIAAITMTAKTLFLLGLPFMEWTIIYGFVFSATLFIYAGHRVIGLQKSQAFKDKGRYKVIADHQSHIIAYAALGGIGTLFFATFLSWKTLGVMAIPGLISLGYIFPILFNKEKKRLRDIDDVKIYFVALVWMVVSVVLPFVENEATDYGFLIISCIETFFFVFAITIPFDIRDLSIDETNNVKTIPARIGAAKAKKIATSLLLISYILIIINIYCHNLTYLPSVYLLLPYSIGYFITFLLICYSGRDKEDYYYTGLLDGTMILLPVLLILLDIIYVTWYII